MANEQSGSLDAFLQGSLKSRDANLQASLMATVLKGLSAYEIAKLYGFVGNEKQWLESLVGKSVKVTVLEETNEKYILMFSIEGKDPVITPNLKMTPIKGVDYFTSDDIQMLYNQFKQTFDSLYTNENFVNISIINALLNYYTKEEVDNKLSTVFKYCGTVDVFEDLPPAEENKIGDTWNILTADEELGVKAGDNACWNGEAWDVLSGIFDIKNATQEKSGLFSFQDKIKLDNIQESANNYTLPIANSTTLGGIKIGDNLTLIDAVLSITKNNIVEALGYTPASGSDLPEYDIVTQDKNGLMSFVDKKKLDGIAENANAYVLPTASSLKKGGVQIGENLTIEGDFLKLTKENVIGALGYEPPEGSVAGSGFQTFSDNIGQNSDVTISGNTITESYSDGTKKVTTVSNTNAVYNYYDKNNLLLYTKTVTFSTNSFSTRIVKQGGQ